MLALGEPKVGNQNLVADFQRADSFFSEGERKFAHKSFHVLATERNGFVETAYSSTFESTKTRIAEVRVAEVRAAEVRAAEVRTAEVRAAEFRVEQIRVAEFRASEAGTLVPILFSPLIPSLNALLDYFHMLWIGHKFERRAKHWKSQNLVADFQRADFSFGEGEGK